LRTDRWEIPDAGRKEYERTADTYHADAWVCGRTTMEEFAKADASRSAQARERFRVPIT